MEQRVVRINWISGCLDQEIETQQVSAGNVLFFVFFIIIIIIIISLRHC